jgi:hypothetical protein
MNRNVSTFMHDMSDMAVVIAIILVGLIGFVKTHGTAQNIDGKTNKVYAQLESSSYREFTEGAIVSGSQVRTAISNLADTGFTVTVKTRANAGSGGTSYNKSDSYIQTDINKADYIDFKENFKVAQRKTSNGTVCGLDFTQQ